MATLGLTRLSRDLLSFAWEKKNLPSSSFFLLFASFSFAVIYIRFGDSFLPPGRLEVKRERMSALAPAPAHSCISFSLRGWFYKCEISLPVRLASLRMTVARHSRKRASWLGKFIDPNKYDSCYAGSIANKFRLAGECIFYSYFIIVIFFSFSSFYQRPQSIDPGNI